MTLETYTHILYYARNVLYYSVIPNYLKLSILNDSHMNIHTNMNMNTPVLVNIPTTGIYIPTTQMKYKTKTNDNEEQVLVLQTMPMQQR